MLEDGAPVCGCHPDGAVRFANVREAIATREADVESLKREKNEA